MEWIVCFAISVAIFLVAIALAVTLAKGRYKVGRVIQPFGVLSGGVFLSALFLFFPVYAQVFAGQSFAPLKTFLLSIHNVMRLFAIDEDFSIIIGNIQDSTSVIAPVYTAYASILYVFAPILTFGFILSFFKNLSAYLQFALRYRRDVYVFSELNKKSLILAEDIQKNNKKAVIVFTDVFENNDEESYELIEQARALRSIRFKKDILSINFRFHSKSRPVSFFVIGDQEEENVNQALQLIERYRDREDMRLYIFSTHEACKMVLASPEERKIKVRRVDEIQSLVSRLLYEEGHKLFENAIPDPKTKTKHISAVIVGLGRYGTEMLKSLAWYCQMDGYSITVDAFEEDPLAYDKFAALCPEIVDPKLNGSDGAGGEMRCRVNIHSGVTVGTASFHALLRELPAASYVFVCLGSDELDIKTAIDLRVQFARMGLRPRIQAVVKSSRLKQAIGGITNYRKEAYDIEFIGDRSSCYTESVIIDSELEAEALRCHKKYGAEEDFWRFEYNYRSSAASAMHMRARIACGMPGAGKAQEDLTEEEANVIALLEHRRWNAYVRTQGYIYSGSRDKKSRNDLAKMHPDLVPFDQLTADDIHKDIRVGSK